MLQKHKKAVLIGETKLCIQCAEYLTNREWKIVFVVSEDEEIVSWARSRSISILPMSQVNTVVDGGFYLFSIINPLIIPASILENPNLLLAINYHDSPLPKYAGVNSTTWAILNNEKFHGVTLHQITTDIDDGDIVAQSIIDIEKDETAISLNLKCSERLLSLFQDVITKIETNTLSVSKQDLTDRSYYGLKYLPVNYGIINGIKDIKKLSQLVRGINLGNGYDNPVASVKIRLNGKFYIVEDFVSTVAEQPKCNTILFDKVKDIYGNETNLKVKYHDILTAHQLTESELQYLSNIKAQERKCKKQILEFFKTYSDASIVVLDQATNKSKKHTKEISLSNKASDATIFAAVYLVLARFFYRNDFIISLYNSDPILLKNLVENRGFICANAEMLNHGFNYLVNYLTQAQKKCCTIVKDFGYRYGLQLLTDIAITLGEVASTDQHKIIIKIQENGRFIIEGDVAYQLQIDNIAESIKAVLDENTQEEIATKDLKHINLLSKAQYQQIVYDWNTTEKDYPKDKTVHQLFEEQVSKTPNNIAVVYEDTKLTYQELNNKANQLANYLIQNYNIQQDDLVALYLDRSEQMIIAMLGVLKAGAAYVPIDTNYPDERIKYILEDVKAKVVLANSKYKDKLQQITERKTDVMSICDEKIQSWLLTTNPYVHMTSSNLIYVIYTSGSTGKPKGVLIEHRSVTNCILYLVSYDKLNSKSIGSQYASIGFDASVIEIYPMLLSGGTLYIVPEQYKLDPIKINRFFDQNGITYGFLPTKISELFFELTNSSLVNLVVGGEKLEKFIKQTYRVINAYGPTETTVQPTNFIVDKQYKNIPIGKPINNAKCYVIDNNLNILPIGSIGELVVGGECLARGYLNHPNSTAEKFISNPFQTKEERLQNKNNRLYKTGDLVCMLPDGNMEYIGRSDFQVQIRGYRVELGEIENVLISYPDIKQSVVLIKEHIVERTNVKYLVAYYVADKKLDETKIQSYLAAQLPEYMLPQILIHISELPLTTNGKLDKNALPEPTLIHQSEYIAPRSELEKKICEMYAQILNFPIQQVGIIDDFFKMGGDSISSIRLVSRIREQLGLTINIKDIFNHRNVEQLVINILANQSIPKENSRKTKQKDSDKAISQEYLDKIREGEVESVYLANNLQQGFISHAIRQGKIDDAYLSQFIWQYKTPIDKNKFKKAWQLVQQKYPNLRLRFAWDKELLQIIDKNQELDFRYIDLTNLPKKANSEYQSQITNIIKKDRQEYCDLRRGNLIRIYLIKLSADDYSCICSIHHIILDGWSFSLLVNSAHEIYSQLLENKQPQITEDITYKKAQEYLQERQNEDQEYWNNYIKQIEDRIDLRSLLKPTAQNIEIKNYTLVKEELGQYIEIAGQKLVKLKEVCQTNAVTINSVIQYAWHKLLHIYGSSSITVVGTVISGRNLPIDNIENAVGLFINTLPLIFVHDNQSSLIEQIKIIQNSINEANSKSNVNLVNLQLGGERLFDSLVVYENYPYPKHVSSISFSDIKADVKIDYPLAIVVYEKEQVITIKLKYAGELFAWETIVQLLDKLRFFIEQISENPQKKTLNYLNQEEYQRIVIDYNQTEKDYPRNKTIHQLFEEQVLKTPNNIAVVYEDTKLTYQELNQKANQLANYLLRNYDIKPDDLIVLCLDRSEQIIITMLGVLKAGGAYVPVDPNYPDERVKYILGDTKTKVILTNDVYKNRLQQIIKKKAKNINVITINNEEVQTKLAKQKDTNPIVSTTSANLIYVIYTSGTTDNPKGVLIEHKSVVNCITYLVGYDELNSKSIGSQYAAIGFDASVIEIYPILLSGGALHVISEQNKLDPVKIDNFYYRNNITYAFLPTKFAELFFKFKNSSLINLIVAGEKLEKFIEQPCRVSNGYGPTENTVYTTNFIVDKQYKNIPIGKPINNVKCYVVDNCLDLLPVNAIGELVIGGEGLARGYLNRSDLTSEKFIHNPFQTEEEKRKNKNSRLYKTGDLVRMLPSGNIEYIGRNDFQVKIRGHRIEFGEIEGKLRKYPDIKQVVVLVKERIVEQTSDKHLVVYYVADQKLNEQKIRNYLSEQLPNYMVPNTFIYIQELPLTENGKLDKKALLSLEFKINDDYLAPRDKQEQLICNVFANVLDLKKVGVNDDFFYLGGNSISAIRLASRLQENFDIKLSDIFELRTPERIAKNSIFGKNFLQHKLEQVKLAYQKKRNNSKCIDIKSQKSDTYIRSIKSLPIDISLKKPIRNILLTGSTGYLGCNILKQILDLTDYKVYLPIRANSPAEATERINKKYQFYFDKTLNDVMDKRVFILKADIERDFLGLPQSEYSFLVTKIDTVIHAAALVKHYGEYNKFYSANVGATINLLEFTKLTGLKDFHYISTVGVLHFASASDNKQCIYTEDDLPHDTEVLHNVYVQTKLQGEHQVVKYREYGLNCNIYRVGNLAFISENCRSQENVDDNAFYNWLKCLFTIKCGAEEIINAIEISQVDLTAQAIIKLFDRQFLNNQIYHVINPHSFNMINIFKNENFEILSIEAFIECIIKHIKTDDCYDLVVRFILKQGWTDWWEQRNVAPIEIMQNRTQHILKQLSFTWCPLTENEICRYLDALKLTSSIGKSYGKETENIF